MLIIIRNGSCKIYVISCSSGKGNCTYTNKLDIYIDSFEKYNFVNENNFYTFDRSNCSSSTIM